MIRKGIQILLVIAVAFVGISSSEASFIVAEDENEELNEEVCNTDSENYDAHGCILYASKVYGSSITSLQSEITNANSDLDEATALAEKYAKEADSLQSEIDALQSSIDALVERISVLEVEIENNEALVEALNTRVKNRMVESQKTMHFNGYLDFVLGSKSFSDLLRRIYGVKAIVSKDQSDREMYIDLITQLNADKKELEESKAKLDEDKASLVEKQAAFIVKKEFYQEVMAELDAKLEELQAEIDRMNESYEDLIADTGLINSLGFVPAVHNSYISDTPWYYSDGFLGGAIHLGVDYAASYGTEVHAPASGIVLRADDSCGYGSLSNYCGAWIAGGGNQVYLMTSVNGSIYAFIFFHLSSVNVSRGDIVMADDVIGKVGSSGKSTGPHCHIEMYYLGDGTLNEYLAMSWNATFYVGRGSTALSNRCELGVSAPCILNPEKYLD